MRQSPFRTFGNAVVSEQRRHENEVVGVVLAGVIVATLIVGTLTDLVHGSWQAQTGLVLLTLLAAAFAILLLGIVLTTVVRIVRDRYTRFTTMTR